MPAVEPGTEIRPKVEAPKLDTDFEPVVVYNPAVIGEGFRVKRKNEEGKLVPEGKYSYFNYGRYIARTPRHLEASLKVIATHHPEGGVERWIGDDMKKMRKCQGYGGCGFETQNELAWYDHETIFHRR